MASTRGSSALSTAVPVAGRASTSSPLPRATPSIDPNSSEWARATQVTTPMVGRATPHSWAMWPIPLAPISTIVTPAPSGALARVSGTPSSLLNDAAEAQAEPAARQAARVRSLTEVLPTLPVMPITGPSRRSRAARPMVVRARAVSSTSMTGTARSVRTGREVR